MPPLQKRVIDVPFVGGPDDKINPHLRQAGQLSLLENAFQSKTGEVRKRNGLSSRSSSVIGGGVVSSAHGLHVRGEELVLHDDDNVYAYSPTTPGWVDKGVLPHANLSVGSFANGPTSCDIIDIAGINNFLCYVHNFVRAEPARFAYPGNACTTLIDADTGAEILSSVDLDSAGTARYGGVAALTSSDKFVLTYSDTAGNIKARFISNVGGTTAAIGSATTIINDQSTTATLLHYTVIEIPTLSRFAVCYIQQTTGDLVVEVFDDTGASVGSASRAYVGGAGGVRMSMFWHPQSSVFWVFYWDTTGGLKYERFNASAVSQGTGTVGAVPAGYTVGVHGLGGHQRISSPTQATVYSTIYHTDTGEPEIRKYTVNHGVGSTAHGVTVPGAALLSHPFKYNNLLHLYVFRPGSNADPSLTVAPQLQIPRAGTVYCVRDEGGSDGKQFVSAAFVGQHPGAINADGLSPNENLSNLTVRNVYKESTYVFRAPFLRAERAALTDVWNILYSTSVVDLRLDLAPASTPSVYVNGVLLMGGGCLWSYDGDRCVLAGLEMQHPGFYLEQGIAGGLDDTNKLYGCGLYYRWVDGVGNEYWSAIQTNTITLTGASGTASIRVNDFSGTGQDWVIYNRLTDKPDVQVVFSRTLGDLTTYYIENLFDNDTTLVARVYTAGTTPDRGTDVYVQDNATVYTTGGALSQVLPPATHHIASDGETAALVPSDKRDTVWVSTPIRSGVGVRFTDDLVYDVPEGGDIEALWFMDGRLIVFKKNQIRYMAGRPPNGLGQQGYEGSELISGDVGCEDWRSVVRVPDGIMFKSSKGFYILRRDLQTSYIGEPVESYNSDTVLSTTTLQDENQVRFCMSGGDVVVYDYDHNLWPRFPEMSLVASVVWDGKWTAALSDGSVGKERASIWRDWETGEIEMKVRTGWLGLTAIQGYERIRRVILLGESADTATPRDIFTVKSYIDFDETEEKETLFSGSPPQEQNKPFNFRITAPTQKVAAYMVEIAVKPDTATDETVTLTGVSFEAGAKKGAPRLSATRTK